MYNANLDLLAVFITSNSIVILQLPEYILFIVNIGHVRIIISTKKQL